MENMSSILKNGGSKISEKGNDEKGASKMEVVNQSGMKVVNQSGKVVGGLHSDLALCSKVILWLKRNKNKINWVEMMRKTKDHHLCISEKNSTKQRMMQVLSYICLS